MRVASRPSLGRRHRALDRSRPTSPIAARRNIGGSSCLIVESQQPSFAEPHTPFTAADLSCKDPAELIKILWSGGYLERLA